MLEYDKNQTAMRESKGRQLDSKVYQIVLTFIHSSIHPSIHLLMFLNAITHKGTNDGETPEESGEEGGPQSPHTGIPAVEERFYFQKRGRDDGEDPWYVCMNVYE